MKRQRRLGFTLIELLIVLAVIAIITAILFPVFGQMREKSRQVSCLSNLHQIALASEIYTQDYDETFLWNPPGDGAKGDLTAERIRRLTGRQRHCVDQPSVSWPLLLQPYLKSAMVFQCPSSAGDGTAIVCPNLDDYQGNYGLNGVLIGDDCEPRTLASLTHAPSEVALVGDSSRPWSRILLEREPKVPWPTEWANTQHVSLAELDQWPIDLPPPAKVYWGWQLNPPNTPIWGPELHDGGSNFAFADGHVKFLRPSQEVIILPNPLPAPNRLAPGRSDYDRVGYFPGALLE
jgi:prepilin-type N-terminal cleavage/methylation domain-containing protein/prepilin-type processing-associated H-X9-DG protein